MLGVLLAMAAVFADCKSIRIVLFVLHGCVIATFAIATSHCEDDAIVFLGHGFTLVINRGSYLLCRTETTRVACTSGMCEKQPRKKKTPCRVSMVHCTYI
jgi:hypothetical protein